MFKDLKEYQELIQAIAMAKNQDKYKYQNKSYHKTNKTMVLAYIYQYAPFIIVMIVVYNVAPSFSSISDIFGIIVACVVGIIVALATSILFGKLLMNYHNTLKIK